MVIPRGDHRGFGAQGCEQRFGRELLVAGFQQVHVMSVAVNIVAQPDEKFWFPLHDRAENGNGSILFHA